MHEDRFFIKYLIEYKRSTRIFSFGIKYMHDLICDVINTVFEAATWVR